MLKTTLRVLCVFVVVLLLSGCSSPPPQPVTWEELNRESQRALELKATRPPQY